jgi:phosphotriesterase-related protein
MPTVETVRGPVELDELGRTLMHEHVFLLEPEALENFGTLWGESPYWDEEERVADAIEKLGAVRDAGIRTIVDPTAVGLGRFIPRIQRLNEAVDLNILVATGGLRLSPAAQLPRLPERGRDRGDLRARAP